VQLNCYYSWHVAVGVRPVVSAAQPARHVAIQRQHALCMQLCCYWVL